MALHPAKIVLTAVVVMWFAYKLSTERSLPIDADPPGYPRASSERPFPRRYSAATCNTDPGATSRTALSGINVRRSPSGATSTWASLRVLRALSTRLV